jgi:hypothetical protein
VERQEERALCGAGAGAGGEGVADGCLVRVFCLCGYVEDEADFEIYFQFVFIFQVCEDTEVEREEPEDVPSASMPIRVSVSITKNNGPGAINVDMICQEGAFSVRVQRATSAFSELYLVLFYPLLMI